MDQSQRSVCICPENGFAQACPQAFVQGGQWLHVATPMVLMEREKKTEPRLFSAVLDTPVLNDNQRELEDQISELRALVIEHGNYGRGRSEASDISPPEGDRPWNGRHDSSSDEFISSEDTQMKIRGSNEKFKPLTINGTTLTGATIGGYKLNMSDLAKEAKAVLPLPPVFLPKIFRDDDLNFTHHFFQGLEMIGGRSFITDIASLGTYSRTDIPGLEKIIRQLVTEGYVAADADLLTFVKRVVSSTFELGDDAKLPKGECLFLVKANLYGFQYIEPGMICREPDLKMWLNLAHSQYKTSWFNTFKSSGIPTFALDGVQDRYDVNLSLTSTRNSSQIYEDPVHESQLRKREKRSKRSDPSKSNQRTQSTIVEPRMSKGPFSGWLE